MQLTNPIIITPRLLPGVQIGNVFVSIGYAKRAADDNRTRYQYYIDPLAPEDGWDDIQSGNGGGGLQEGLSVLLCFLGAAGEAYRATVFDRRPSENSDLFAPTIAEWCYLYSDEIGAMACELQETPDLIDE